MYEVKAVLTGLRKKGVNLIKYVTIYAGLAIKFIASQRSGSNRIAVIRTDLIGDNIVFSGAYKYIKQKYSGYEIIFIGQEMIKDLLQECPYLDGFFYFEKEKYRKNIFYRVKTLARISKFRFKIVLNPMHYRDTISDELALWAFAKQTVGWGVDERNMNFAQQRRGNKVYTDLFHCEPSHNVMHEIWFNIEFLKQAGIPVQEYELSIWSKNADVDKKIVQSVEGKKVVSLIIDASRKFRTWGVNNFQELAKLIVRDQENVIILILAKEKMMFENICSGEGSVHYLNLTGQLEFSKYVGVIGLSSLVIGNETGGIHVAAAKKVKSVCLLGGGHFNRFLPYPSYIEISVEHPKTVFYFMECYNCNWQCKLSKNQEMPYPCLSFISVDSVFKEAKKVLD